MRFKPYRPAFLNHIDAPPNRHFIRAWIGERSKFARFGYADIARNGNFAARSFPRDVASGTKRITLRSLEKFTKGMGLSGDLASYFKSLVEVEEAECRRIGTSLSKAERTRTTLKARLLAQTSLTFSAVSDAIFEENLPRVYAALGTCETGAEISSIRSRTRLDRRQLQSSLQKLANLGCVKKVGTRYFPVQNHISLEKLTTASSFRHRFQSSARRAEREIEKLMSSPNSLFFASTFSVRASDLPSLKEELKSLLNRYVDTAEAPEGDRVVELVTSLLE
jgi:uncharacterized protein (TIGR02147 family)